jgi:hypothetical protein
MRLDIANSATVVFPVVRRERLQPLAAKSRRSPWFAFASPSTGARSLMVDKATIVPEHQQINMHLFLD